MTQIDWQQVRADYEAGQSLRQLAATYHVSKSAIGERKFKEQWTQRTEWTDSGHSNGTTHDLNALARVHNALRIYLEERPTWDEIAARSGYSDRGAAHHAVKRELERRVDQDVKDLRTEELYMLQQLQARCYKGGMDEKNKDWTWVIDRFEKLSKRKSELMGMDVKPDEALVNQNYVKRIVLTHAADAPQEQAE